MNHWKIIYSSYRNKSSRTRLFLDTIKHGSKWDKSFILICLIAFLLGLLFHFIKVETGFALILIGEFGLLYKFDKLKQALVLNEYGDPESSQTPHNDENHQASRYLMFKQELILNFTSKSHVKECFELADCQIDIAQTSGISVKKYFTFSIGIFIGILGSFWRSLDSTELIYVGATFLILGLFIGFIISLFPSKIERLKEMKYFMLLYCREESL